MRPHRRPQRRLRLCTDGMSLTQRPACSQSFIRCERRWAQSLSPLGGCLHLAGLLLYTCGKLRDNSAPGTRQEPDGGKAPRVGVDEDGLHKKPLLRRPVRQTTPWRLTHTARALARSPAAGRPRATWPAAHAPPLPLPLPRLEAATRPNGGHVAPRRLPWLPWLLRSIREASSETQPLPPKRHLDLDLDLHPPPLLPACRQNRSGL